MPVASSSTSAERDERVFVAAFGLMDSHQDGEAVAAFMRVRTILHRHGGGFRRLLERSHEAERLNEELGRQNAQLLRENAVLRARDSRPASPAPINDRGPFVTPAVPEFRHWDLGLIGIIVISTNYGLLGFTASLTLTAAILICAAFANWFSPIRFFAGLVLGLTALGIVMFNRSASADAPAVAVVPAVVMPVTSGPAFADAAPPSQTFVDMTLPRQPFADSPSPRRIFTEPRSRHAWAPRSHCGIYRLQPGFTCPRSTPWRRTFLPDFGRSQRTRYD
jgi:hypothetical protein